MQNNTKPPLDMQTDDGLTPSRLGYDLTQKAVQEAANAILSPATSSEAVEGEREALNSVDSLAYLFETEYGQNPYRPRIIDLCYTAFMIAKQPNKEDGGASDWFTDTKPHIDRLIKKMAESTHQLEARAALPPVQEGDLPHWLMDSAKALLELDASKMLVPHGIGGHARNIIQEFINYHEVTAPAQALPVGEGDMAPREEKWVKQKGKYKSYDWSELL